jgi:hypothetical protein
MMKIFFTMIVATIILNGCKVYNDLGPGEPSAYTIKNGSFEQTTDGVLPIYWKQTVTGTPNFNFFEVSGDDYKEGTRALRISYIDSLANPHPERGSWGGLSHQLKTDTWDKTKTYKLGFWYRSLEGNFLLRVAKNGNLDGATVAMFTAINAPEWRYQEIEFSIDATTESLEIWISTKTSQSTNGKVTGWIDDMKIIRVDNKNNR